MAKNALQRTEIVAKIASTTGLSKAQVDSVLTNFFDTARTSLAKGTGVKITGYLSLETVSRKARKGHNPSTGAEINIPARKVVKARVGSKLAAVLKK